MSYDLNKKLEKQHEILELLTEDLRNANQALKDNAAFTAGLEQDLDNAIIQMQMHYLEGRI